MKIHGPKPSPFARKVIVALEEKGLPYELVELAPLPKTPELLAMHPMGKVPILELDDGTFVPDSSVILAYLERAHPEPSLLPEDPKQFARALFLEEYADTKLVEVAGAIFFEHFVKPNVFKQDPDTERTQQLIENDLPPVLDWLETQVPAGGDPIFGRISVADIALGAHLGSLGFANVEIDATRWPKLAAQAAALWSRPSFKTASPG